MKGLVVVAFLLSLNSSIANAQFQSEKPIICDQTKKIIESLTTNFYEKPIWTAMDAQDGTRYSLFVNSKTGAWTLLQMTPEYACILGVGEESTLLAGETI
jgi:hypothetical protein